jgi:hypothetical protein
MERQKALFSGKDLFLKLDKPEPFCLVALSLEDRKYINHVGVVWYNSFEFIHISEKTKVSIERLDDPLWFSKIRGYYKCPN